MAFLHKNAPINGALIAAARNCPHQVVRVKPTKTQLKVLDAIKMGESVTAQQMAERCDISQSFTSTLLKGLVEKGYLTRKADSRLHGGVEFDYSLAIS
ncbi:MarR family transcriptional regulator [Vibrio coralliilyticus]|uniref:MarR family transcriptional regulator n=1 Tax=Vibrio coralliilyticus TaxID=190893 RepID=UPI001E287A84|nr:helix-turn-helix domain-containing protein [Vibrio coralliilyticus]MCC2521091.1 MarR family transcriptional regulator [Vibrio coralliilyticus]